MDKVKLDCLYKGQKFEYETISDLYTIGYDAFKAPVDYGIDVIGVPKPFSQSSKKSKQANIMLIQTKSIPLPKNKKTYKIMADDAHSSDIVTIRGIELNEYIDYMNGFDNVLVYMIVYVTIPEDMYGFIFGESQDKRIVNNEFKFFLSLNDLEKLRDNNYLYKNKEDKYNMDFRMQGVSKDKGHSLEIWIHCQDNKHAWALKNNNDLESLKKLPTTNLKDGHKNYYQNRLNDYTDNTL